MVMLQYASIVSHSTRSSGDERVTLRVFGDILSCSMQVPCSFRWFRFWRLRFKSQLTFPLKNRRKFEVDAHHLSKKKHVSYELKLVLCANWRAVIPWATEWGNGQPRSGRGSWRSPPRLTRLKVVASVAHRGATKATNRGPRGSAVSGKKSHCFGEWN